MIKTQKNTAWHLESRWKELKDDYINGITKTSDFEDAMFIDILGTEDTIERAKYIEDVRKK